MKKLLLILLVVICAVSLFGCNPTDGKFYVGSVFNNKYTGGASVKIDGSETHYDSIAEAWKAANSTTEKAVDFILWEDWTATEGNFGKTNETGFNAVGGLVVEPRGTVGSLNDTSKQLTIDLNEKTINANRTASADGGNVISINCANDSNYHASVKIESGTIKGGTNNSNGGGISITGSKTKIYFQSLSITGNTSGGLGGGVYEKTTGCCFDLSNVSITGNKAQEYGGGFASETVATSIDNCSTMNLKNKILICDNSLVIPNFSTGLYIKVTNNNSKDDKNTLGNIRFGDISMTEDSKVPISSNGSKVILTFERTYDSVESAQDNNFTNEMYANRILGFYYCREESKGCGTYVYYGFLYYM